MGDLILSELGEPDLMLAEGENGTNGYVKKRICMVHILKLLKKLLNLILLNQEQFLCMMMMERLLSVSLL